MRKSFASDNYSGVHPKIMKAIVDCNVGHQGAYGNDEYTKLAVEEFKKIFGDVEVFFVFNGTGANVVSLDSMKEKASAVICTDIAHIFCDETGAPSKITGMQLFPIKSIDGKLNLEDVKQYLSFKGDFHKPTPKILSITQSTELGTIYSLDEIKEISEFAHKNGFYLHMDGARISNAAVALNCGFKEMTGDLGIDVLSFGGTKNGLMMGEAIVFFNKELAKDFLKLRKQDLQLSSKMRYISSQFIPYLKDNIWYEAAKNSNDMAKYFCTKLNEIGIEVINEVSANALFAVFPKNIIGPLQEFCYFYVWDESKNIVRLVTSFDITKEDIDIFIDKIKSLL